MGDSEEDDDWFLKDIEEFVAPVVLNTVENPSRNDEMTGNPGPNPFIELLLNPGSGGAYSQQKPGKSKSRIPDNQKILPVRLKKLLTKPDHTMVLDLFTNQDKWESTIFDFCDLKDTAGLDLCMELLGRVSFSPLSGLRTEIVRRSCRVPLFFTFYIKSAIIRGAWRFHGEARRLIELIRELVHSRNLSLDWFQAFMDSLKILPPSKSGIAPNTIEPKLRDFTNEDRIILEPVQVNGPIENVDRYLINQMGLLREESIRELRELIMDIRDRGCADYFNGIQMILNERQEIYISDPPLLATADQYIHGSLLLFSSSTKFEDLILATVTEYSSLSRELRIELLCGEDVKINIFNDSPLIMVCSPVFFEPHYRVHQRLEEILRYPPELPFQDIFFKLDKSSQTKLVQKVNPTITGLYPRQVEAVTTAVSHRLTLIQGPPGTGKSFVGLKTIENLLKANRKDKILIVSVTNHALDEVLKGLTLTTQRIVRFGTQSKERELDRFNIRNVSSGQNTPIRNALVVAQEKYQLNWDDLEGAVRQRRNYLQILQDIKHIDYLSRIESANVIGMTTTAAARLHTLLELFKPRVLIAEEAAQILECHTMAVLTTSLEQFILIGDHNQLRATLQVPNLATIFNFDVSLFERLICNGMRVVQLDQQSRMRPELANLVRGVFYESYSNSPTVKDLPDAIRGMERNLFFMDHRERERATAKQSKANTFEAHISLSLADYLLKQGYRPSQIVILSFYNGHLELLNALRNSKFPQLIEVKTRTVDNFQGEESDIVILNGVRSNLDKTIGHVGVKNRICTAMTRAKYGLFIIGDAMGLREGSGVWKEIIDRLESIGSIAAALPLRCDRHGNAMVIRDVQDFQAAVNCSGGCVTKGCDERCNVCDNVCPLECHSINAKPHVCNCI